jgi:hypothetical protein
MEENVSTSNNLVQDATKKGLMLGLVHIIIFLLIYYLMPSKLTGFLYLFLIMFLNLGYVIYNGIQFRNEIGGYMDYGPAFKYVFILLIVNGVIGLLFGAAFVLVEPAYPDVMAQSQLDTQLYWAQRFGAPESAIDEMRDKFDFEEMKNRYSFKGLLFGSLFVVLFDAIGAAIAALFVRKRMPETF